MTQGLDRARAEHLVRPDPKRMIASFPLAVLLLAPDMTISAVNPAAEQLLGQGARRLVGKTLTDVLAFEEP
jgi:two-component system nitrogen regulation sensor histidine kinase GlnL